MRGADGLCIDGGVSVSVVEDDWGLEMEGEGMGYF